MACRNPFVITVNINAKNIINISPCNASLVKYLIWIRTAKTSSVKPTTTIIVLGIPSSLNISTISGLQITLSIPAKTKITDSKTRSPLNVMFKTLFFMI